MLEVRYRGAFNRGFPLNHRSSIRAILVCLFVAGHTFCAITKADVPGQTSQTTRTTTLTPCPSITLESVDAADALVKELGASDPGVRDKAATALQAMGKKAAKALARQVNHCPGDLTDIQRTTKAVTVLAKIGNDIANNDGVRAALLFAACLDETKWPERPVDLKSAVFQLRFAAIDALGEINKYRGNILPKDTPTPSADSQKKSDPDQLADAKIAATSLAKTAKDILTDTANRVAPTPKATPSLDADFTKNLVTLHDSQAALVNLAGQVNAAASPPKKKAADSDFPKLSDEKALADSLRKIEIAYVDATKKNNEDKLKLWYAYDKSVWQFRAEAAYDLLTETKQLKDQIDDLTDEVNDLTDNRKGLNKVISTLGGLPKDSSPFVLRTALGTALNAIFSKPPMKKSATDETKKDQTKKDAAKKDSEKKEDDKRATAEKDSDEKDPNNSEVTADE